MPAEPGLRILLVSPQSTGGIGSHVDVVARGLIRRGARVTVCAPAATIDRLGLDESGVTVVRAPVGDLRGGAHARRLIAELAAKHDLTHAHGVRAAAQVAAAGIRQLVATWHNAPLGPPPRRAVHRLLERYSAPRCALVFGASADLVARASSAGAPRVALCEVTAPSLTLAASARERPRRPPVVLAVARLHPQKRLDLLIDVAARWPAADDRPVFLIAGDGPLDRKLREHAHTSAAPVEFLGARSDVATLLAGADVVVLPSDWEARPLVAQEALRAGVPLVATDVGGVRDLVGDAAVLVPAGDRDALAEGIGAVLHDAALRDRLRRAGPLQAGNWPTVDDMVDRLWREYLDLNSRLRSSRR